VEASESLIRQFLYLDVPLVNDLLSQLEGGSYDSEIRTTEETRSRDLKGEVGVGTPFVSLKAGGGKNRAGREEIQRKIERTDPVRFANLYGLLMDQARIQKLGAVDQKIWDQLEPSEFLDLQAIVTPSSVAKTVDMVFARSKMLANVFTALGYDVTEVEVTRSGSSAQPSPDQQEIAIAKPTKESTTRGSVPALMKLIVLLARFDMVKAFPKLQIVGALVGSPDYEFIAHLDRKHLRVASLAGLTGEMKVFGRLEQKLTDPYSAGGLSLEPPIAMFQPVAIYQ
jgi:hypothetical protein